MLKAVPLEGLGEFGDVVEAVAERPKGEAAPAALLSLWLEGGDLGIPKAVELEELDPFGAPPLVAAAAAERPGGGEVAPPPATLLLSLWQEGVDLGIPTRGERCCCWLAPTSCCCVSKDVALGEERLFVGDVLSRPIPPRGV
jgi:hypothetical protein